MKSYIIDDEEYAIDTLAQYISNSDILTLKGSSTDAERGLSEIKADPVDVVFLDIDMPGLTGIEVAGLLPLGTSVIFTSGHSQYAVDAFNMDVVDFLLKPVSKARFLKAIDKLQRLRSPAVNNEPAFSDSLFVNPGSKGSMTRVFFKNIIYIEGLKNYITIHTVDGKNVVTYLTMNEVHGTLPKGTFLRIHKSLIVNADKIESIEGNRVTMTSNIELPIGISYKADFLNKLSGSFVKSKRSSI